ncbi:MAG: FkbM family methyltransferase [Cytophagia bacterium]|nr:FkbM family methyltransferase [Cytophagia bacterium]
MKKKFDINIYQIQKKDPTNAFHTNILKYALFPNDNAVTSSIIQGWQYEKYMFDFLERNQIDCEDKTILDIGGNNGNFAIDFAHLVGDKGSVHSFEPQRIIYYQLCANVFLNGLDNVHCHNVAVGDRFDGYVNIETPDYYDKGYVNFGDVKVNKSGEKVEQRSLDSYTFDDVVFIKIDVQGYESFVIDGAEETIKKHRPYLFVEFEDHLLKEQGTSEEELKAKIEALGYVVLPFQEGIPYQSYSGKCLDYVCIPTEKYNEFNHIIP